MDKVRFWRGATRPKNIDPNTLYFVNPSDNESGQLFVGDTAIANWTDLEDILNSIQNLKNEIFLEEGTSSRIDAILDYIANNEGTWTLDTNTEYSIDNITLALKNTELGIKDNGISKNKLNIDIQNSLDKADSAVQPADLENLGGGIQTIIKGSANGTIEVDDVSITVYDDSQLAEQINNNTTKIINLWSYGTTELEVGVTTLESGKIYFCYDGPETPVTLTLNLLTGVSKVTWEAISPKGEQTTGSLTATGNITVSLGSTVTFTATASSGYALDSYTNSIVADTEKTISFTAAPVPMVNITISMDSGMYSVGWRLGTTGSYNYVYSSTTISVEQGSTVRFTYSSKTDYSINSYVSSVVADQDKTVSFTTYYDPEYLVRISVGTGVDTVYYSGGGYDSSTSSQATLFVSPGTTIYFNATAETDYVMDSYPSSIDVYDDTSVSFTATYVPPPSGPYTIRVSAGGDVWDYMIYINGSYVTGGNGGTTESFEFDDGTVLDFSVAYKDGSVDNFRYTVTGDDYIPLGDR